MRRLRRRPEREIFETCNARVCVDGNGWDGESARPFARSLPFPVYPEPSSMSRSGAATAGRSDLPGHGRTCCGCGAGGGQARAAGGQGRVAGGEGSVGGGGAPGTVWFKSEYENPSDDSGDEDRALEGGCRAAGSERSARHAVVSGSTGCVERAWLTPLPE